MAACFESSLPGRCEQATHRSRLASERRWLGHGCVVQGSWVLVGKFCSAPTSSVPFPPLLPLLPEKFTVFFSKRWVNVGALVLFLVDASWIISAAGWYQEKESFREVPHLFASFVFAQNSAPLVLTLPAFEFGTLHVGIVNRVSEVMAEQHLSSWGVLGEGNARAINYRLSPCFSFCSRTLLLLIKTSLEDLRRVRTPLGYSGSQNPQGQAASERCLLPQPMQSKITQCDWRVPMGTLHTCNVTGLRHGALLNGHGWPPCDPLREGEQQ